MGRPKKMPRDLRSLRELGGSECMDLAEVAQIVDCSPFTVRRAAFELGQLPYLRIGRLIRFRKADVERWMEERARGRSFATVVPQRKRA